MGSNDAKGRALPVGPPLDDEPLLMTASIPNEPIRGTDAGLQIETRLTNVTDSPLELRTMRSGADISVVQDGVVIRPPGGKRPAATRFTLAPGASRTYESTVNLGYPTGTFSEIHPLAPGTYQLYAVQRFTPATPEPELERAFSVHGGPWDIQIV
jgi:hypothetical protein